MGEILNSLVYNMQENIARYMDEVLESGKPLADQLNF